MSTVLLDPESHTYTSGGKPILLSVSDVLRLSGIVEPYPPHAARFVEAAGELGETVHQWCQFLDEGGSDVSALEGTPLLPYLVAYQRFREKHLPDWEQIEQPLADEELGIAGTPDRIGYITWDGARVKTIVDLKTAKKPEKWWGLQLALYKYLYGGATALLSVHLRDDGQFTPTPYLDAQKAALAAVEVAHWKILNGGKIR